MNAWMMNLLTCGKKLTRSQLINDCVKAVVSVCQVDVKSSGKTALQVASHQGYLDIAQLLLKANTNLQLQDEDGDTALHYSAFGY